MQLDEIYRPIKKEMAKTERLMKHSVERSGNAFILKISDFLQRSRGKRLRLALVVLSAKAVTPRKTAEVSKKVLELAAAVELSHLASLIHDDVVDHSAVRRLMPTANAKWGEETSIILGDYLYSVAFNLIASCGNPDILASVSQATRLMCEGELVQICERDNLSLLKDRYITIIKNKTANLFAASCHAGALAMRREVAVSGRLKQYGLNFGIAFQIVDDTMDLIGKAKDLGKDPGGDFKMGELTLPLLNLLRLSKDRKEIYRLLASKKSDHTFDRLRQRFINSEALTETKKDVSRYIAKAKRCLGPLEGSVFKQSLLALADYVEGRITV